MGCPAKPPLFSDSNPQNSWAHRQKETANLPGQSVRGWCREQGTPGCAGGPEEPLPGHRSSLRAEGKELPVPGRESRETGERYK